MVYHVRIQKLSEGVFSCINFGEKNPSPKIIKELSLSHAVTSYLRSNPNMIAITIIHEIGIHKTKEAVIYYEYQQPES